MLSKRRLIIGGTLVAVLLGLGIYFLTKQEDIPETITPEPEVFVSEKTIGSSVEGRPISVSTFGAGDKHLLFVGGIHGGYEWNSVILAYEFIDYFTENPEMVPDNLSISIIPSANPDGIYKIIGKEGRFTIADVPSGEKSEGRFNSKGIDLNRNFDCKWQAESSWRGQTVSAGETPFSEPEARAIRDYVLASHPELVVFWHSAGNAVYASECLEGILPETLLVMNTYAGASKYSAIESFDAYPITGDAEGWLASIGIPAITVELASHETTEWGKNLLGVKALINYYKN